MKNLNFEIFNSYFCANLNVQRCIIQFSRTNCTMEETMENIKKMNVILFTNARDESHIKEWAVHHLLVGFDIIYIFDHRSKVPIRNEFEGFKKRVVVERCNMDNPVKIPLMERAVQISKSAGAHWMLYLDADEFLILNNFKSVKGMLLRYQYAHAIGINWLLFGTNNHIKEPEGFILENYTKSDLKLDKHVKTFVRPRFVKKCTNPHYYQMGHKCKIVSINHEIMTANSAFNQTEMEYFRTPAYIAHYIYQSEESYVKRKLQLPADDTGNMRTRDTQIHEKHNGYNNEMPSQKYLVGIKEFLHKFANRNQEGKNTSSDETEQEVSTDAVTIH